MSRGFTVRRTAHATRKSCMVLLRRRPRSHGTRRCVHTRNVCQVCARGQVRVGAMDLLWSSPWQVQVLHGAFGPTPDTATARESRMAACAKGKRERRAKIGMVVARAGAPKKHCLLQGLGFRVEVEGHPLGSLKQQAVPCAPVEFTWRGWPSSCLQRDCAPFTVFLGTRKWGPNAASSVLPCLENNARAQESELHQQRR